MFDRRSRQKLGVGLLVGGAGFIVLQQLTLYFTYYRLGSNSPALFGLLLTLLLIISILAILIHLSVQHPLFGGLICIILFSLALFYHVFVLLAGARSALSGVLIVGILGCLLIILGGILTIFYQRNSARASAARAPKTHNEN